MGCVIGGSVRSQNWPSVNLDAANMSYRPALTQHNFVQPVDGDAQPVRGFQLRPAERLEEFLQQDLARMNDWPQPGRLTNDRLRTGLRGHGFPPSGT